MAAEALLAKGAQQTESFGYRFDLSTSGELGRSTPGILNHVVQAIQHPGNHTKQPWIVLHLVSAAASSSDGPDRPEGSAKCFRRIILVYLTSSKMSHCWEINKQKSFHTCKTETSCPGRRYVGGGGQVAAGRQTG